LIRIGVGLFLRHAITGENGKPAAFWIFGGYRDEYVRQGGRWLFRRLSAYVERMGPHDRGWA
jgi:hypothetical protein